MSRTTTKIVIARTDGTIMGQYVLGLGEHIIGREIDCAIFIDDPHVSRAHARLVITNLIPADYVYMSHRLAYAEAGQWGLLRVLPNGNGKVASLDSKRKKGRRVMAKNRSSGTSGALFMG